MKLFRYPGKLSILAALAIAMLGATPRCSAGLFLSDTNPPAQVMRLFFIHHSTGENWLRDDYGRLGMALRDNNYFVSDSNYGWGPDSIGDTTDMGHWYQWFCSDPSATYLAAVYASDERNCDYSRPETAPSGPNQIVLFKSCFPNSALQGSPSDPVPAIANNPLKNQDAGSDYHTVANAKGIYRELLTSFAANTNKLFVAITAPPLSDSTWAANARAFNEWLIQDWLAGYPHANVFVFDFYNVLTSNGGSPEVSDVGWATGHHHRWWQGTVQHLAAGGANTLAYPSDDDHPNPVGSRKATEEFVPLLNAAVRAWQASFRTPPPPPHFTACQISPTTVSLTVSDLSPDSSYALQGANVLSSGGWSNLAVFSGVVATNWSEPIPSQTTTRFYRLQSQ